MNTENLLIKLKPRPVWLLALLSLWWASGGYYNGDGWLQDFPVDLLLGLFCIYHFVGVRADPVSLVLTAIVVYVCFSLAIGEVSAFNPPELRKDWEKFFLPQYRIGIFAFWLAAWGTNGLLAELQISNPIMQKVRDFLVAAIFGVTLLAFWELFVRVYDVSKVLLPPPSDIYAKLSSAVPLLISDFRQTVLKAVIPGWIIGSLSGFLTAILCDRVPFLRRGLLPLGNFFSVLPMVGVAPILVMWFGFDWQSKAAMVVVMTFFPMLVNAVTGLAASGHMERDLMRSYGSSWWQSLVKLRLPAAMPFIFNALKINSTLALIGAIVAEFFGTPIVGMGFRISTEVGRQGLDMVWAEIAVAAVTGSIFYGLLVLAERAVTFWHPSYRT